MLGTPVCTAPMQMRLVLRRCRCQSRSFRSDLITVCTGLLSGVKRAAREGLPSRREAREHGARVGQGVENAGGRPPADRMLFVRISRGLSHGAGVEIRRTAALIGRCGDVSRVVSCMLPARVVFVAVPLSRARSTILLATCALRPPDQLATRADFNAVKPPLCYESIGALRQW